MRVRVEGFELGKCYWIKHSKHMEIYAHFSRKNTVYMEMEDSGGFFNKSIMSKKKFKYLIKDLSYTKEEIPASDLFSICTIEDYNYWDDYACENGCCSCCGCSCYDYEHGHEEVEGG